MTVKILKHFVSDGKEYGYYLVDGTFVVQNENDFKAIPFLNNQSIKDCLINITEKAKEEINRSVQYEDCYDHIHHDCSKCLYKDCSYNPEKSGIVLDEFVGMKIGNVWVERGN